MILIQCVKLEQEVSPFYFSVPTKIQPVTEIVRAYGSEQVKRSDLANRPETDESRLHVRRHWVCWHKLYPECGSDTHPALVSLLLSYYEHFLPCMDWQSPASHPLHMAQALSGLIKRRFFTSLDAREKRRRKEGEKKRARRGHTALSLLWSFGE